MLFESKVAKASDILFSSHGFGMGRLQHKHCLKLNLSIKHGVVGCESCGQCRLGDTLYICPETCPKGLANGPCGGTTLDR